MSENKMIERWVEVGGQEKTNEYKMRGGYGIINLEKKQIRNRIGQKELNIKTILERTRNREAHER